MVIKVKEITIGRGRKYSQNYQSVDYHISVTIEGTTAKDTLEDLRKEAITTLTALEMEEQTRCRDVMEITELQEEIEFKEAVEKTTASGHPVEKLEVSNDIVEYDGRKYKKFIPCKYKCGMWTAWATDYKQGDRKLHMNPMTKEIIGLECPKYAGGGN